MKDIEGFGIDELSSEESTTGSAKKDQELWKSTNWD
jgi:hypothetical protein